MIHIYKDELDEINIKLITNKFIKVRQSRIVTFGLLILRICLFWFIYRYCLTNLFSILPFSTPWNQLEKIENKWVNVTMRGLRLSSYAAQFWILEPPPPSTHMYAFGLPYFSLYDVYIKPPCQPPPEPPSHKLTRYNHLTYNAFKYLPIKSYQLLIQLKQNREQEKYIASCF